jgi:hypothetical protein
MIKGLPPLSVVSDERIISFGGGLASDGSNWLLDSVTQAILSFSLSKEQLLVIRDAR